MPDTVRNGLAPPWGMSIAPAPRDPAQGRGLVLLQLLADAPLFIYHQSRIAPDVTENTDEGKKQSLLSRAGFSCCLGDCVLLSGVSFSSLTILQGQSLRGHPALDLLQQAELAQMQPPRRAPGWRRN